MRHPVESFLLLLTNSPSHCCQIYAVAPVKISESPASRTAIVEHLYNFPPREDLVMMFTNREDIIFAYMQCLAQSVGRSQLKCVPSKISRRELFVGQVLKPKVWLLDWCNMGRERLGTAHIVACEMMDVGL